MTWREADPPSQPAWPTSPAAPAQPPGTLAAMRDEVRARLAHYPEATVVDALLVSDVLITDALRSGQAIQQLRVHDQSPYLRIEITSAPAPEQPNGSHPDEGTARLMLEELTHSWGVERGQRLLTAWAEVPVTY